MQEKYIKIVVRKLTESMHQQFKIVCIKKKITMQDAYLEMTKRYIDEFNQNETDGRN